MKKFLFLLAFVALAHISHAQQMLFYPSNHARVVGSNSDSLINSFAGGLANPIFSNIDFNNDSRQDLFIFDKHDNRILTFLNIKTRDTCKLVYTTKYENAFPQMRYWAFLQDFNGDGKADIFMHGEAVGYSSSLVVYKNISTATELKFELYKAPVMRETSAGSGRLSVNEVEMPTMADMDNDGDLDILKFDNFFNTTIWYYNNRSQDLYSHSDSLVFWLYDQCWGRIEEPEGGNTIYTGINCNQDLIKRQKDGKHAGSTLLAFDYDGDGDKDLVVGDTERPTLSLLENSKYRAGHANLNSDSIYKVNNNFPFDKPSKIMGMVLPSMVDINADGHKDIVLSPMDHSSKRKNMIWMYHNFSKTNKYFLNFKKTNFLEESMLDMGINSMPCLFYYNNDSLPDLLVSVLGEYDSADVSHIAMYVNVGTKEKAVFKLADDNFLNYISSKREILALASGDIDGDGKHDIIAGNSSGTIYLHKRYTSGSTTLFEWPGETLKEEINSALQNIDVGNNSVPAIADLNRDGKADILIGSSTGALAYYRNISTGGVIKFEKVTDSLASFANDSRVSATLNHWDNNDTLDMLVSTQNGKMQLYMNVYDGKNLGFPQTNIIYNYNTSTPGIANFGKDLIVTSGFLDQDKTPDILVGNTRGGLYFFGSKNNGQAEPVSVKKEIAKNEIAFKIYPNPAQNILHIKTQSTFFKGNICVEIKDISGKTIHKTLFTKQAGLAQQNEIALNNISNGFYLVQLLNTNGEIIGIQKLIISR